MSKQRNCARYNRLGWVVDLPDMTVGRKQHGCAGYRRGQEDVNMIKHR